MARRFTWSGVGLALLLAACSPAVHTVQPTQGGSRWDLPFPADQARQASSAPALLGMDYSSVSSTGTAVEDPALRLLSGTPAFKWGMYTFELPQGATDPGVFINVMEVTGSFYVAAADYAVEAWSWFGPFTEPVYVDLAAGDFISPLNNINWVVATGPEDGALIIDCTVSFAIPPLEVPPAGQTSIAALGALPSLVHEPYGHASAALGAPVVVFSGSSNPGSSLSLAVFRGGNWETLQVEPGRMLTAPQLLLLSSGALLIAHDTAANTLVALSLDYWWRVMDEMLLFTPPAGHTVSFLSADLHVISGELGVLHSTTSGATTGSAWYTSLDTDTGTGLVSEEVYTGETVAGLSVAFAADGTPWAGYTHGTVSTTGGFTVDLTLDLGSRDGGSWQFALLSYADDPFYVDMSFDGTGQPQVLFTANRTGRVFFPGIVDEYIPVMFDVIVGRHNGASWDVERVYESSFEWSIAPFDNPPTVTLTLNMAPLANWSRTDELSYNRFAGDVVLGITNFDPIEFEVQDGTLSNNPAYMDGGFGSFSLNPTYFDGADGMNFSWAEAGANHGTAYVANSELDLLAVLGGNIQTEGELLYWRK